MKKRLAMLMTAIMILSITASALPLSACAATDDNLYGGGVDDIKAPQSAPLNPDFVAYWKNPPDEFYGYIPPPMDLSHLDQLPVVGLPTLVTLPSSFDWRDYGKVTPVKNQNPCGACWAFGTTSVLESAALIGESATYDFSEQSVALCVDRSWVYLYDDWDDPCMGGGWSWLASEVFIKKGSVLESCNPYNPSALNCDGTCVCDTCPSIKKVDGYRLATNDGSQIDVIKDAVYNQKPVTVVYYHDGDYEYWDPTWGAIYDYYPCSDQINHLISIIGWDDDVPHPNPSHTGTGAWLVKNSWGTVDSWAGGAGVSDGFFYLAYDSSCVREVAYLEYKDPVPGEELLYWDEAGQVTAAGYGDNDAWMASVFTADQGSDLTHVDFWTTSNNAQYEIYVWDGFFGTPLAHQTGTCQEAGYYSIPLSTPISIGVGQQFTVGVDMTTPGYNYPIPIEEEIAGRVDPPIQPDVSFIRHTSSGLWVDLAGYDWNACLRARMVSEEVEKTVVSIEDASAPQGGTVTVPINIAGVENMCGASIWLNYNKDVVIVDSVSDGDLVPLTHSIDNPAGVTKINWDTTSGMTGDFVFAYVTLKAVGNRGDTCLLDLDVKELYDCVPPFNEIPRTVVDGTFKVMPPLMEGDVTDINVCVSLKDSTLIKFYLVDMATLTPDQLECADTNDDGEVTLKDSTAIKFWLVVPDFPLWQSPADDHMMKPVPCSAVSLASAASTTVSIEDTSAPQGETVTVPINIAGVENMCGANIWLNYNKEVVIVDSVSDGDLVPLTCNIDNPDGVTKMTWDTTSGMTGDFVFAYVTLKAVGNPGDTCLLDLDVKELYDCVPPFNEIPRTVADGTFTVRADIVPKPDLIITEKWLCWPDNCTICYNVTNIGEGTAPACHNTALYVDGVDVAHDHVPMDLATGESHIGCFDGYTWTYTPPSDDIRVCADSSEALDELYEDNNCLTNIWMCGDVNSDGKVTMSDVRKVFNRYLDPNYPLDLPWAADVNCDGKVSMSDVRKVFNRYLDPGYELECCCEV